MRAILLIILVATACTSPNRKVIGPDGSQFTSLECVDLQDCYDRADDICMKRKQIIESNVSGQTLKKILIQCE